MLSRAVPRRGAAGGHVKKAPQSGARKEVQGMCKEKSTASPRGTSSAKVIQVIRTTAMRGKGNEDDPCRIVIQYWSLDGEMLAECDPESKIT